MEDTKISVIIPTYNSANTLRATIESCLNQTLPPIEVLVCDDGSTDDSEGIVKSIHNSKVKWIPSLHSGTPAVPRNNGVKIARGKWIAFCDSDDEWLPEKLKKQIDLANKMGFKASCTAALVKMNGVISNKLVSNWKKRTIKFNDLLKSNDIVCSSAVIHSSIVQKIGEFSCNLTHRSFADYIYWLRILTLTNFAFVNEPLAIYDDHPQTSIRSDKVSDNELQKISFRNFTKWIDRNEKNIFKRLYFKLQIKIYKLKSGILIFIKDLVQKILK